MEDSTGSKHLLQLLLGETAKEITAISPRLALWAEVFERWLGRPKQSPKARRAWASLLGFTRCPPWENDREKIEAWMEQMGEDGLSPTTIEGSQSMISSFYRFCARQPEMLAQEPLFENPKKPFNPARGSVRPQKVNYQHAYILTAEEARRLLRAVDRERSLAGKRDYAFLLTLLLSGMDEHTARLLRWGDVGGCDGQKPELATGQKTLPGPAWEAVVRYLRESGRLESIQPGDYVFAPQVKGLPGQLAGRAEEWIPDRPISSVQVKNSLTVYARWAGLEAEKVTFASLRHTAAALQIEQGAEVEEVQRFLGRAVLKETRVYAGLLGRMLARRGRGSLRSRRCPNFPAKGPYTRRLPGAQPGNLNSSTHGYYARLLPEDFEDLDPEEAKIMGIENEIVALRMMLNRTFGMARDVDNLPLMIRITGMVGSVTTRIAKLLLVRQELRGEARGGWDPGKAEALRRMVEEMKNLGDTTREEQGGK